VGGVGGFPIKSSILMVGVSGGGLIFKKSKVGVGGGLGNAVTKLQFLKKNFAKKNKKVRNMHALRATTCRNLPM
jgi:hypothetical protein